MIYSIRTFCNFNLRKEKGVEAQKGTVIVGDTLCIDERGATPIFVTVQSQKPLQIHGQECTHGYVLITKQSDNTGRYIYIVFDDTGRYVGLRLEEPPTDKDGDTFLRKDTLNFSHASISIIRAQIIPYMPIELPILTPLL